MTTFDLINFFSAAISTVLALVALWLSLYFFRQSSQQAQQARKSAEEIAATVSKLEKLFDTLYSDTFSMMRETVTDMRAHIWRRAADAESDPEEILARAEATANARIEEARLELLRRITAMAADAGVRETEIGGMLREIQPAVTKALEESSGAGAERTAKAAFIFAILRAHLATQEHRILGQQFSKLVASMRQYGFQSNDVANAAIRARGDGWLSWDGPSNRVHDGDTVRLVQP